MTAPQSPPNTTGNSPGSNEFHNVPASRLKPGTVIQHPIYDNHDILLLAAGQMITVAFLDHLQRRGVVSIKVHESELALACAGEPRGVATTTVPNRLGAICPLRNSGTDRLDELVKQGKLDLVPQRDAVAQSLQPHGTTSYDDTLKTTFAEHQAQCVGKVREVFTSLVAGAGLDQELVTSVVEDAVTDMLQDSDLFACLGINPFAENYPARHSLHTCMLSLIMGTRLNFDRSTLKELGTGCLIHDAGMLKIDSKAYDHNRILTPTEFLEITKHPILTFDMLKDLENVSPASAMIAYQIHERCDGSGYPRRRKGSAIHPLSKIAAVADSYVGLVSPRAYRPAMLPYRAMETMLKGVKDGLYDSLAVRALMKSVSLFPLGSYVKLSDGRVGRAIRANLEAYTTPIIEAWHPDRLEEQPEVIDLLDNELKIVAALPSLEPAA